MYTSPVIKKLDSIIKGTQDKNKGDKSDGGTTWKNKCKTGHTNCS